MEILPLNGLRGNTSFQKQLQELFLKISRNSQETTCARVFFNKVADLRSATLLKKRLWHRCFPVSFEKFLRTSFSIEHLWRLRLLSLWYIYPKHISFLSNSWQTLTNLVCSSMIQSYDSECGFLSRSHTISKDPRLANNIFNFVIDCHELKVNSVETLPAIFKIQSIWKRYILLNKLCISLW